MLAAVNGERVPSQDAIVGSGSFSGPCIPDLAEHYFEKLSALLALSSVALSRAERKSLQATFVQRVNKAYADTPYARFLVVYQPGAPVSIEIVAFSLDEEIKNWVEGHGGTEPYGAHPDAKVISVAKTIPPKGRVLDVGAGNGRNALPLARLGFAVEALERAEVFVTALRAAAEAASLPLRVLASDLFAPETLLEPERYDLILLSEVFTHFTLDELENGLARLCPALAPSGLLLCNAFLWHAADEPESVARHAGKTLWATFFTRPELLSRCAAHGVELVSDEPASAYEQANLPPEAWPPNKWFEGWAKGNNVFDERFGPAPVELRWLLLRRAHAGPAPGPGAEGERA